MWMTASIKSQVTSATVTRDDPTSSTHCTVDTRSLGSSHSSLVFRFHVSIAPSCLSMKLSHSSLHYYERQSLWKKKSIKLLCSIESFFFLKLLAKFFALVFNWFFPVKHEIKHFEILYIIIMIWRHMIVFN